ncbi:hypothetical protein [Streptomyces sp. NRRL S-350]|uniref:hypothetical protein n=1 Tax=Streptomyces sp. NRRL S-350 TaxID=1463902 RepID=UPI0004C00AAB|nr:hypothetical protein [Streptomyces sp. NRRL S-350]
MSRFTSIGHATATLSDGGTRHYLVHGECNDVVYVTPGEADSVQLFGSPWPVRRSEFTTITVRPGEAGPITGDHDVRTAD